MGLSISVSELKVKLTISVTTRDMLGMEFLLHLFQAFEVKLFDFLL